MRTQCAVGIDVSGKQLEAVVMPSGEDLSCPNTPAGIAGLVRRCRTLAPRRVVLEATGKLEREAVRQLVAADQPVSVVNPWQARQYAHGIGQRAKADHIDDVVLARMGLNEDLRLVRREETDGDRILLRDLVARREEIVAMLAAEKQRRLRALPAIRPLIAEMITVLTAQKKAVERQRDALIAAHPDWQETLRIVTSVPGVDAAIGGVLVAFLPELGTTDRQHIAGVVGVAPYENQSGGHIGERHIAGGRMIVRNALYMAALTGLRWNPVIRAHYGQLVDRGKKKKVALVACMRKLLTILNAMGKHHTTWEARQAAGT